MIEKALSGLRNKLSKTLFLVKFLPCLRQNQSMFNANPGLNFILLFWFMHFCSTARTIYNWLKSEWNNVVGPGTTVFIAVNNIEQFC